MTTNLEKFIEVLPTGPIGTLRHGFSKSKNRAKTHPFYKKFENIKNRCGNPKYKGYKIYGGRGIKVEWSSFDDFYRDMYPSYLEHLAIHGEKQTTLDRIDVNGNYCKKNCRWATRSEQNRNTQEKAQLLRVIAKIEAVFGNDPDFTNLHLKVKRSPRKPLLHPSEPKEERCDEAWDTDYPCDLPKGHEGEHKNSFARG